MGTSEGSKMSRLVEERRLATERFDRGYLR